MPRLCRSMWMASLVGLLLGNAGAQTGPKALWGSYGGPPCYGDARIQWMEALVGQRQSVVLDFLASDGWQEMVGTAHLLVKCHPAANGRRLVVSLPMVPRNDPAALDQVARGAHRHVFEKIARALVAGGHGHAIVRLGWEFNGNWYAWASRGREDAWKEAWRSIVTAMRSVEGQAFLFDWTYAMSDNDPYPVEKAYPGDDVVDVIGADLYNQTWRTDKPSPEQRWLRFVQAPRGLDWLGLFAGQRGKWMSLPEWGTGYRADGHGAGDSPEFVRNALRWVARNRVLYQAYWNYPAKDFRAELRADDLAQSRAAYAAGMKELLGAGAAGK